jgi:N-acetylmuramoyl-L-alanine amidase
VSNKEDLQSLLSDAWRDRMAASVAQAIDTYFSTHVAGTRAGAN